MEWGKQSLSFSVFHEQDNRVLHTEIVGLEKELYDFNMQDFEKIFREQAVFAFSFEKITCLLDTSFFTLVPQEYFDESKNEKYLKFVHDLPSGNFLHVNEIAVSTDYQLVYAFPKILKEAVAKHFVNTHFSISQLSLLNYFAKFSQLDEFCILHFNESEILIFYYKGGELKFFNSFAFINAEDVVYHTLHVLNTLGLNNEKCVVHYSGMLGEESSNLALLKQYVKYLKPLERTNKLNYSPLVEQMPAHYFIQHYASIL